MFWPSFTQVYIYICKTGSSFLPTGSNSSFYKGILLYLIQKHTWIPQSNSEKEKGSEIEGKDPGVTWSSNLHRIMSIEGIVFQTGCCTD